MVLFLFGFSGAWGNDTGGGAEAKAENGRLTVLSSWWGSADEWEGRWWWRDSGSGTAWVRAWGVQAGPLVGLPSGEGWKEWGHRSDLASGHWGVAVDGGGWGTWAVQDPGSLEAGAQAEIRLGDLTWAGGGDRTWSLSPGTHAGAPWTDRCRVGLGWDGDRWGAGAETTVAVVPDGNPGWSWRYRGECSLGPVETGWKGAFGSETDPRGWTGAGTVGWEDWAGGWSGDSDDPGGRWKLGWAGDPLGLSVHWGPRSGWGTGANLGLLVSGIDLGARAQADWNGRFWTGKTGLTAGAPWNRGRWHAGWSLGPGAPDFVQTVTVRWREPVFEAECRWTAEGLRLGWVGPGSNFNLTLRYFF